ncbi:MAG: aldo/keto reductase [Gemmataceae bacterium]
MLSYTPNPDRYDGRMPYRRSGRWGLKLPAITLGCWQNFGGDGPTVNHRRMIYTAFDHGITHFDLANNYGPPPGSAETNVGKILEDLPRDEILVSSKAGYLMWDGPYGEWSTRKYLLASLDQSLQRLGLEYVDIFYSHRFDPDTPLEETLSALDAAVRSGKALYAGISSYSASQTRDAVRESRENDFVPLLIHQPNYSMFNRWIEKGLLAACGELGLGIIAFCPLYQGLLTERYLNGIPAGSRATVSNSLLKGDDLRPEIIGVVRELNDHARQRGQTLAQMALAWVLRDGRVTSALIGASRPEQIVDNVQAVKNTTFSAEELAKIDHILSRATLPPSPWAGE